MILKKTTCTISVLATAIILVNALLISTPAAQEKTPGYNTKIPESIMTPNDLETRVGTFKYFDGIPTEETAAAIYNHLDYIRGVESFLNGMPAASLEAIRRGQASLGGKNYNQVLIFDQLMDSNPLFLTGNTDTVYVSVFLDLKKDGPTVIEIPPGTGPGTVNDAFFRFVTDTGPPGPDRGKGGKYLILPPDYVLLQGEVPDGYFVAKSTSWTNWFIARGFLKDGKPDFSSNLFRDGLKIYPLSKADNQPEMEFYNASGKAFNTIHSTDFHFFEELHAVIDREPIEMLEPQLRGIFASIGIQKGKPFIPDARMKDILTKAAEVANATARTMQPFPSYNSEKGKSKVAVNDDGSVDLYIGPEAPAGKEANWLQTVPGKGWFCVLRLYSPTEDWFDKTWRPGEIELVN
jgi:hypothetical protein